VRSIGVFMVFFIAKLFTKKSLVGPPSVEQ
jgi:hypothetical protein